MTDTHSGSVGDTLPERNSQEWRTREAMSVFDLLRKEYNDSKRLDMLKRYTELERIIDMFTSESVMTKLLWLSTDSMHSSESMTDIYGDSVGVGVGGGEEDEVDGSLLDRRNKGRNSHMKLLDWIRNITFRFKSSVPIVSKWGTGKSDRRATRNDDNDAPMDWEISCDRHCVQSPKPNCAPKVYSVNSMSCLSQPSRPRLASFSNNDNICYSISSSRSYDSNLFTFNEAGSSHNNFGMTYSHGSSSFRRLSSDINANQIRAWERIDSTDASTDRRPAFRRRSGIETCVIRRENTPEFQIPRQYLVPTQTLQLNPALYRKNDTNGQTTSKQCRYRGFSFSSRLQTSMSAYSVTQQPAIGFGQKIKGMLSHDRRQGKRHCSESSILNHTKFFNDNDVPARSFNKKNSAPAAVNSLCIAKSVEEKAKLLKAYDKLMDMKREYDELNESSIDIPTRYRRMKAMIKTCMEFQI